MKSKGKRRRKIEVNVLEKHTPVTCRNISVDSDILLVPCNMRQY